MFNPVGRAASALAMRSTVSPGTGMPAPSPQQSDEYRKVAVLNKEMNQATERDEVHLQSDAVLRSAAGSPTESRR